jgi:hypothetical protein
MKYKVLMSLVVIALLFIPLSCTQPVEQEPPQDWYVCNEAQLLSKCEQSDITFEKRYVEWAGVVSYYYSRMIGDARVMGDFVEYRFDNQTGAFISKRLHWRDDLPDALPEMISKEEALAIGGGTEAYLLYIDPESVMFSIEPTENPCWSVYVYQEWYDPETNKTFTWNVDIVVVDAVTGKILGHGIPLE